MLIRSDMLKKNLGEKSIQKCNSSTHSDIDGKIFQIN
jgi:hypothetical protein